MFHVGQRVVCVDDVADPAQLALCPGKTLDGLTKGSVYTVRGMTKSAWGDYPAVLLVEINRDDHWLFDEVGFRASRFRPVDETRLSVFRAMLVSPPKVDA